MNRFSSGLIPYSDAERERDRKNATEVRRVATIRRESTKSRGSYDSRPSAAYRRFFARLMGLDDNPVRS